MTLRMDSYATQMITCHFLFQLNKVHIQKQQRVIHVKIRTNQIQTPMKVTHFQNSKLILM